MTDTAPREAGYLVYWTRPNGLDGDKSFDDLESAAADFDERVIDGGYAYVELSKWWEGGEQSRVISKTKGESHFDDRYRYRYR